MRRKIPKLTAVFIRSLNLHSSRTDDQRTVEEPVTKGLKNNPRDEICLASKPSLVKAAKKKPSAVVRFNPFFAAFNKRGKLGLKSGETMPDGMSDKM